MPQTMQIYTKLQWKTRVYLYFVLQAILKPPLRISPLDLIISKGTLLSTEDPICSSMYIDSIILSKYEHSVMAVYKVDGPHKCCIDILLSACCRLGRYKQSILVYSLSLIELCHLYLSNLSPNFLLLSEILKICFQPFPLNYYEYVFPYDTIENIRK